MLRVLSPAEELKGRRERFAKLRPESLFDVAQKKHFIAAHKLDKKTREVIELTDANKRKILSGDPCKHFRLHFDEMDCLNLQTV